MAEYIEREAAIDKHCAICKDNALCYRSRESCPEVKAFNSIPAADVAHVRHGRWKPGDMPTYGGFKCSLCKKNTIVYKPPYCPNCGAKMDKEVNE